MALTTTSTTNPVKTIIIQETASTSANGVGVNNVAGGPAYLHSIEIDNSSYNTDIYVKLYDLASAVAGTDNAEVILLVKNNVKRSFQFFPGLQFSNAVTLVTTITAGQAGTNPPTPLPNVRMVLSESAS